MAGRPSYRRDAFQLSTARREVGLDRALAAAAQRRAPSAAPPPPAPPRRERGDSTVLPDGASRAVQQRAGRGSGAGRRAARIRVYVCCWERRKETDRGQVPSGRRVCRATERALVAAEELSALRADVGVQVPHDARRRSVCHRAEVLTSGRRPASTLSWQPRTASSAAVGAGVTLTPPLPAPFSIASITKGTCRASCVERLSPAAARRAAGARGRRPRADRPGDAPPHIPVHEGMKLNERVVH
jgi:hypothetical protein